MKPIATETGPEETGPDIELGGVRLAAVKAGIRYSGRLDLVLVELAPGSNSAGVFTQNAFCAAPVTVCREHLRVTDPRYFLINTGNANAGTGKPGRAAALACCAAVAELGGVAVEQVLPFSTGVIGEPLPTEKIIGGLKSAFSGLGGEHWPDAARGIMTTDTVPKLVTREFSLSGQKVRIAGIAKGAGMIRPDMATMLAFVFTDAGIARTRLQEMLREAVGHSFNRITVDGDASTNDSCVLVATGSGEVDAEKLEESQHRRLQQAFNQVFVELATALIRDAEGATKFISINVSGGADSQECLGVAYAVAESPLVKTACFASDPNWGRILAAVGRAGVDALDPGRVNIALGKVALITGGTLDPHYRESLGRGEMEGREIAIRIDLGRGEYSETVWTSDLSHEYVRINAAYRT